MDIPLYDALLKWLRTFPGHENLKTENLTDGVTLGALLHQIAPECFSSQWKSKIRTDVNGNWRLKVSNLRKIHQGVMDYFCSELAGQAIDQFPNPDLNKIGEFGDEIELGRLLQLVLGCAINCEQKQNHIEAIMRMEERVQALIVNAIQDLMNRDHSPAVQADLTGASAAGVQGASWLGPASFHPHMKALVEQLESTSLAKDDMTRRCNELDLQISVLIEERNQLKEENNKLSEQVDILQNRDDISGQGSSRYKEVKKQVDTLQDELYKLESSRDEYRSRSDDLERENKEITMKNDELQKLADEARSLKDEVDVLRDMSDRVAVYEGTVETYKKKMEELSDLKRQIKILEEKNSEYMQINMELEEEVKKSGTWRPQLDLYKKQVADLHQKLADEAKKTDRQIFDNKKMVEKLEAITHEKDRMNLERDLLKENVEELRMTVLSSPENASRPPSDLEDIQTLEIIPPEIREKLVRLQHENRVLKQKADEKPNVSGPVLQSLLNDLQERHDKLLQENRWGEKFCTPSAAPIWSGGVQPTPSSLLNAFFMLDSNAARKNLKWASESDLLVKRQPSNLFTRPEVPPHKALTLPPSSLSPTVSDPPIVIHHIHEFKIPPVVSPEDSGCCRTSPSSCEDHPSGTFTPPDSFSGMFRCLSPVIPSIVEQCTTNHLSDIVPVLCNQDTNVLYHSHNSCNRCCSPFSCMNDIPSQQQQQPLHHHARPEPPDSPTPHNSPRLPHSIHNSRSKKYHPYQASSTQSRNSVLRSAFFEPTTLIRNDRKTSSPESFRRCNLNREAELKRYQQSVSEVSDKRKSPTHSIANSDRSLRSNFDRVRSKTPDKIKSMFHERFRMSLRERSESVSSTSNRKANFKTRSKSLDKGKIKASSKFASEDSIDFSTDDSRDIISKRKNSGLIDSVIIAPNPPVTKDNLVQAPPSNVKKLIGKSSLPLPYGGSPDKKSFEIRRGTSTFSSLRTKMIDESVRKQSIDSSKSSKQSSLLSLTDTKVNHEKKRKADTSPKIKSEITLLTDTMFTHFMVPTTMRNNSSEYITVNGTKFRSSPSSMRNLHIGSSTPTKRSSRNSDILISDVDTDLELMENKLILSAYGAPLVSSESAISMLQSDQTDDLDPSATDYNTDNLSDIHQFPQCTGNRTFLETDLDAPDNKIKVDKLNQIYLSSNDYNGKALVKAKNRTAKAVVAETFNAMFTFCTP